jgi:hypothetical protein
MAGRRSYKTELAESQARYAALEERFAKLEALVSQGQVPEKSSKSKNYIFRHGDVSYEIKYDREYTWVYTSAKPSDLVLKALRGCNYDDPPKMLRDGPRGTWSRRRGGWYYTEKVTGDWVRDIVTGKIPTKSE